MKEKFTKGPWSLSVHTANLDGNPDIVAGSDWTVFGAEGGAICFEGAGLPEEHYNAHLIAAAPEMYKALKYAKRFLKPEDVDMEYIDSVLAKARGEQDG